jgi:hypothetical protein
MSYLTSEPQLQSQSGPYLIVPLRKKGLEARSAIAKHSSTHHGSLATRRASEAKLSFLQLEWIRYLFQESAALIGAAARLWFQRLILVFATIPTRLDVNVNLILTDRQRCSLILQSSKSMVNRRPSSLRSRLHGSSKSQTSAKSKDASRCKSTSQLSKVEAF